MNYTACSKSSDIPMDKFTSFQSKPKLWQISSLHCFKQRKSGFGPSSMLYPNLPIVIMPSNCKFGQFSKTYLVKFIAFEGGIPFFSLKKSKKDYGKLLASRFLITFFSTGVYLYHHLKLWLSPTEFCPTFIQILS